MGCILQIFLCKLAMLWWDLSVVFVCLCRDIQQTTQAATHRQDTNGQVRGSMRLLVAILLLTLWQGSTGYSKPPIQLFYCGQLMSYGDIDLGQQWFRSCGIYRWAVSQDGFKISICQRSLKVAHLKLLPYLPGAKELMTHWSIAAP